MSVTHELWLCRDTGDRLALLDTYINFEYAKTVNEIGAFTVTMPITWLDANPDILDIDRRINIWRKVDTGLTQIVFAGFVRRLAYTTDEKGMTTITISGPSLDDLARRRIIAYADEPSYDGISTDSEKIGAADNAMKAFVSGNMGLLATDTARRISSTYFAVETNLTLGPTVSLNAPHRNLFDVLNDLADQSRGAGTELYWSFVPVDDAKVEFRVNKTYLNEDHTLSAPHPVLLGIDYGNLVEASLEIDWSEEVNYIYAAGQGEDIGYNETTVSDSARLNQSIWARTEAWGDVRENPDDIDGGVTASANQALAEGRPRRRFSAQLIDSVGTRYGLHYNFGDRVTAEYRGHQYDCLVRSIRAQVEDTGKETLEIRLEMDE